jgi:hypothetical protein
MFFVVLVVPAQELYNELSRLVISLIFACSSGALLKKGARQVRLATRMTEEFINATSDELIGAAERASSVQPSRRIQAGVQHFAGDVRRACLRTISRSSAGRQWSRARSSHGCSGAHTRPFYLASSR